MKKVMLIGEQSLISQRIKHICEIKGILTTSLSLRDEKTYSERLKKFSEVFFKFQPTHVINCAAIVGMHDCFENPRLALAVNAELPKGMLDAIGSADTIFIQISTEAVFPSANGDYTFDENDTPNPQTTYGRTKLEGEMNALKSQNSIVVRLPRIFDTSRQIVAFLLSKLANEGKISVTNDNFSTPIISHLCADWIVNVLPKAQKEKQRKVFHITGDTRLSMYQLIHQLVEDDRKPFVVPVSSDDFPSTMKEPKFLNGGLRSLDGLTIPLVDSIQRFKDEI